MDDMLIQPQQDTSRAGPLVPWQLRDLGLAGAWVLAVVILVSMVVGIALAATQHVGDDVQTAAELGTSVALEVALLGAAAWFSVRRYACGWRALGFRRAVRGGWWVSVAVVLAAFFTVYVYIGIAKLFGLDWLVPEKLPDDYFKGAVSLPLMAVLAIVAAPIAEETFFRGFLFPRLRMRWGTFWAALASGLLFAAVHFNLGSIVPFTVIGMLLAWAYVFSGSLWTAIGAHFIFNSVSFGIAVATGGG
jgi:membrane protease YdiL (CAAX protease family)